jgi:hypothetical protein
LRQFCVDNGGHRSINWGKGQGSSLSFHDTPTEQSSTSDKILTKQLGNDVFDIRNINLVDEAIDRFLQGLPCHPLIFFARLVRDLRL